MTTYLARRVRRYRRGHRLIVEPLEQRLLLAVCDPDADGEVTRSDAALLGSHYGLKEGASERLGDCNGDGAVNLFDVGALQDVFGVRSLDFGDASDRPYPTRLENDGARHLIRSGFHLGSGVDRESDGAAGSAANGDDTDADGDDEDGVSFYATPTPGEHEPLRVMASAAGRLDAWADWNRDGDWDDEGEQIFASEPLFTGTNALEYFVPAGALTDRERATQARFRFSSAGGLTPRGLAADGEVEDYELFVYDAASMPPSTRHTFLWDAQADLASATEEGSILKLEASGPTTIELSPAINLDNGFPLALGGPDTLPIGSWHFDVKLLDAILDGSTRTGSQFDAEESLGAGAIKETDGDGVIEIVDGFGGEWIVDSFFDISYEIELADTRVPTEIQPGDGSVRVESHRRIRAATLDDWLPRALELELAESDVGNPHVDVNPPHAVQYYLDRLSLQIPRLDRGDAPDGPYPTLAASGGAAHVIRPGYSMGPSVDADANGQPHPIAEGDDGDADGDDENGVILTSAVSPGGMTTIDVTAVGGKGYLNAWADFNRNGVWDATEQIFTSKLLSVGVNSLSFAVPAATVPDAAGIPLVISRWRLSRQKGLATTGLSSSGEVEDHLLRIGPASTIDFGDAPAAYPTRSAQGGASHTILPGAYLGRSVDADTDGQPDPAALGDDVHPGAPADDEDGVIFTTPLVPGGVADLTVEASVAGRLDAFIDFDRDGDWDSGLDQVFSSLPLVAGVNTLEFSVPANAVGGRTYARIRFSRAGGLGPTGPATDGEVEDYAVYIDPAAASLTVVQTNQSNLDLVRGHVQFAPPTMIDVRLSEQLWTQVLVPGAESIAGHDGMPAVPIFRQLVAIPHGAQVIARSVRTTVAYDAHIDEVFGTQGLLPFQPAALDEVTLLEDYPSALFDERTILTINREAYATNAPFPREVVSFTPLGKLRHLDVGLLEIAAGQYNPVEKRLTLLGAVEWEVEFVRGDRYFLPREAKSAFENASSLYEGVLNSEAVLANYEPGDFQIEPCGATDIGEEFLILTHPDFRPAADALAAWKEQKGIVTSVFEVGTGTPDNTKEEIYDLINFRYDNCPVRPSYAMLLGDAEFIPTWYHQQVGKPAAVGANQDVDNGQWVQLGTVNFSADGSEKIEVLRLERTGDELHNGRTVADAVRLVKVGTGQEVIVDNDAPGFSVTGAWAASQAVDQYGATSLYTNEVDATAAWPLVNLPGGGLYEVYAWWSAEAPGGGKYYRDMTAQYQIYSANTGTDTPYAQVADNLFFSFLPVIGIGRVPVDSLAQATTVVNKIIGYEQSPPGSVLDSSFYEHATVAAAFEGYQGDGQPGRDIKAFVEGAEAARNTLMAAGYTVDRIYGNEEKENEDLGPPDRYYNGAMLPADLRESSNFPWDGDGQDVVDAINDGRFLVIHRDHAGAGGWGRPGFRTDDFGNLTNGDRTPIVYSINCSSGNFDNETSGTMFKTDPTSSYFAEQLLRRANGAVGLIAATRVTNTAANTVLFRGLMDATWTNSEPDVGGNTPIRRLGDILNYGKLFTLSQVGVPNTFSTINSSHAARTMVLWQTFGDPTLEMWTESPHHFMMPESVEFAVSGARSIEVAYAAPGAKLTAFQEVDGVLMPLGRVMLDARGQATMSTFEFDPLRPIVFAACRDDAVCVAPTGQRRASGSPEVPAAVVAGVAERVVSERGQLLARRVVASQSAVDRVFSQTHDDTSHAARALRVLRASRQDVRDAVEQR